MKPRTCFEHDCSEPAEVGIRTTHGGRDKDGIVTTVYTAATDAPESASGYCQRDAAALMSSLITTMAPASGVPRGCTDDHASGGHCPVHGYNDAENPPEGFTWHRVRRSDGQIYVGLVIVPAEVPA